MRREYAVPTAYWATNDLSALRTQLAQAEATAASAQDWPTRARAQQDVKQLKQQIAGGGLNRRAQTSRTAVGNRYAAPKPYFATEPKVAANAFQGLSFVQRHQLVQTAMAELQRVGAA